MSHLSTLKQIADEKDKLTLQLDLDLQYEYIFYLVLLPHNNEGTYLF